jgi:hypothetical protein
VAGGGCMRPVGDVLKALVGLIAVPRRPATRGGEVRPAVVPELLPAGGNRASTVGGPTVLATAVASCSIVRVAEASVCARPLIVGASAVVSGASAVVAEPVARPAGGALFVAERRVGETALLAGAAVVVTRAIACATGVAAPVTGAGGVAPAAPFVVEVGVLSCTGAAALVTRAAAFVRGAVARITGVLVFAADAAASSAGARVPGAGAVAFGAGALGLFALGAPVPLTGIVAWLTGPATCPTVDVTGCVACPTVPPSESAMAGDVPTATIVKAANVAPMTRDQGMRSTGTSACSSMSRKAAGCGGMRTFVTRHRPEITF